GGLDSRDFHGRSPTLHEDFTPDHRAGVHRSILHFGLPLSDGGSGLQDAGYFCGRSRLSSCSATSSTHTVPAASMTNRRSTWFESPVLKTSRYSRHPALFSTYVRFADCGSVVRNRGFGSACSTSAQNVAAYSVFGRSRVIRWESAAHWLSAFSLL